MVQYAYTTELTRVGYIDATHIWLNMILENRTRWLQYKNFHNQISPEICAQSTHIQL